jgi:hypothetical protein
MTEKEYWKMAGKVATRMKPSDAKTNSEMQEQILEGIMI